MIVDRARTACGEPFFPLLNERIALQWFLVRNGVGEGEREDETEKSKRDALVRFGLEGLLLVFLSFISSGLASPSRFRLFPCEFLSHKFPGRVIHVK
ncbi:unnamed protein product [Bursaphelenchus okinawaensis]|uniref:Uncharacterized protein n=1 Tax=Bursaphelenchus okinawaensis TaxID=465554 RepID=A0A811KM98_9BILA|nr:unnamed protein product [Bursaphelenchus okinawaensis]CAG9106542.1 unnamed protein product [Bursaphelenchus okinawaensis]